MNDQKLTSGLHVHMEWNEHVHDPITNKYMSQVSALTSQESMSGYERPRKRARTAAASGKKPWRMSVPRGVARSKSVVRSGQTTILPLIHSHEFQLAADPILAFAFDHNNIYINGTGFAVIGLSDIAAVFELIRVKKVEVSILPAANSLDYNNQTLTTGQTNIPYIYTAVDYTNPALSLSLSSIKQNPTCRVHSFDKTIRRTFYPRAQTDDDLVDVGVNNSNTFVRANSASSQCKWNGFQMCGDLSSQPWTYGGGRIDFKIFYECVISR